MRLSAGQATRFLNLQRALGNSSSCHGQLRNPFRMQQAEGQELRERRFIPSLDIICGNIPHKALDRGLRID